MDGSADVGAMACRALLAGSRWPSWWRFLLIALGAGSALWLRPGSPATAASSSAQGGDAPTITGSDNGPAQPGNSTAPATTPLDGTATFGDGVAVSIGALADYKPSSTASQTNGVRTFVVTVTVHNNSAEVFEPSSLIITASVDGQEADEVFDSANDISGPPSTSVQPGRTATYRRAFNAPVTHGELQIDATPSGASGPTSFTGNL